MTTPGLRPLGFGDVLSTAADLYTRSWRTFVPIVLAVVIPAQLLTFLILVITVPDADLIGGTTTFDSGDYTTGEWVGYGIGQVLIVLINVIAPLLVVGGLYRAFAELYLGGPTTWRESLAAALQRVGSLLWLSILISLVVAVGLLACLVGVFVTFLFAMAAYAVAIPVLFTESLRGTKAMGRSWNLVKPDFWWVLGVMVVAWLIYLAGALIVGVIAGAISAAADTVAVSSALQALGNVVIYTLVAPFIAAVATVLYFDLRLKREGQLDTGAILRQIDPANAPGAPQIPGSPPPAAP